MIMAGSQPYFMPYLGYWQMINAVDVFAIGDDYNFIKGGWINRNRILQNKKVEFFTLEVAHASSNKYINELFLSDAYQIEKKLHQLTVAYQKAPYYQDGIALMSKILRYEERNLAKFLEHSIRCVCDYLDIKTKIICSSSIRGNTELKREYRIFDQCKHLSMDSYVNAIGGQSLYDYEQFREQGIRLGFIQMGDVEYKQFDQEFIPSLSIIDVIMFNSKEEIQEMLNRYTILWEEGTDTPTTE